MSNPTMEKFGYPNTLVCDYEHWCVLVRPAQATLGALVLVCKEPVEAFSDVSAEGFAELAIVTRHIETGLQEFRHHQRINYLMLMMVDKDVHFHVLPRYDTTQAFEATDYPDAGWPAVPDLSSAVTPSEHDMARLVAALRSIWPKPEGGGAA